MEKKSLEQNLQKALEREPQFEFNPDMLKLAREFCGMTKKQLADDAEISASFVTQIEDGTKLPSMETLEKIANATGFPVEHFFVKDRYENAPTSMFRKRKTIRQSVLKLATAKLSLLKRSLRELLAQVEAPPHKIPRLDPEEVPGGVPAIAEMTRMVFRIPDGPIRNLTAILEEQGVIIIPFEFGTTKIDGCSDWVEDIPVILFNPKVPRSRIRHTLAHELGHLVMHEYILNDVQEGEADMFAGCFNMPAKQIRSQLVPFKMERLVGLKAHWKSSMAAILHRATDLNVITQRQARYFWMNLRKTMAYGDEPNEDLIPVEKPRLFSQLVSAVQESEAVEMNEIHQFLKLPAARVTEILPINGYLRAV